MSREIEAGFQETGRGQWLQSQVLGGEEDVEVGNSTEQGDNCKPGKELVEHLIQG